MESSSLTLYSHRLYIRIINTKRKIISKLVSVMKGNFLEYCPILRKSGKGVLTENKGPKRRKRALDMGFRGRARVRKICSDWQLTREL